MWSPALARLRIAKCLGGLTRRQQQGRDAAFERGDALLDDVLRRIHDPGVDVAGLGEAEQRGGVLGAVERVRRGLVDRQGACVGRDVRGLARVHLLGFERPILGRVFWRAHGRPSICVRGPVERTRACRQPLASGYSTWSSPGAPHRGWRVAGQQAGAWCWHS